MRWLCWFRHRWRELWNLERVCDRCGTRQFCEDVWGDWQTVTPTRPNPHEGFYEKCLKPTKEKSPK
jgi:hypothetical protein